MNKAELISEVARRTDVDRLDVARVVDAVLVSVRDAVARGQRVSLSGFGSFERQRRNPRIGRNPRTGEPVRIPARNMPSFSPGTGYKQAVADKRPGRKRKIAKRPVRKR